MFDDPARFVTVSCSRRAGKTDLSSFALLWLGLNKPGSLQLYVAPTMVDARDTIWGRIKELNAAYHLGWTSGEQRLDLRHPNGSEIRFRGAKDEGAAQHLRGPPQGYDRAIIDEAQNYGGALRTAIVDALLPAMTGGRGVRGTIWVMGTPSLVRVGYWHDTHHRTDGGWSHHSWTLRDNPHLRDIDAVMAEAATFLGGVDAPAYRREWLGEWVTDLAALVFPFDTEKNLYDELPTTGPREAVIGVDLGHHPDASAIDVECWWPQVSTTLYGVDEWVKGGKEGDVDIDDIAEALIERIEIYKPVAVVVDEGGLGALVAETLRRRKGISCQPAAKFDKIGAVNVFNTDLRRGQVKVRRGARSVTDMAVVRWDRNAAEKTGKLKIAAVPHSDIMDAKLYAHRRARHYLAEGPVKPAPPADEQLVADRIAALEKASRAEWWEDDGV